MDSFKNIKDKYNSISDMQHKLNCKIGYDTLNDPMKKNWTYNFLQALSDEIVEAKNCISWKWWTKEGKENGQFSLILDPKNLKIELIDMVHFMLCLDHISEYSLESLSLESKLVVSDDIQDKNWLIFRLLDDMLYQIQDAKRCLDYFAIDSFKSILSCQPDHQKTISTFLNSHLWNSFFKICKLLDFSWDEVVDIYIKKNKVNFERQENGYSMLTKTEDDNNKISMSIK